MTCRKDHCAVQPTISDFCRDCIFRIAIEGKICGQSAPPMERIESPLNLPLDARHAVEHRHKFDTMKAFHPQIHGPG